MIPIAAIQADVAASFRIPRRKMTEPIRRGLGKDGRNAREFSIPRQVAMYLCVELTDHSYNRIGDYFGRRDHSTVIHAISAIESRMAKDHDFATKVKWIRDWLKLSQLPRYPQDKSPSSFFVPVFGSGKIAA